MFTMLFHRGFVPAPPRPTPRAGGSPGHPFLPGGILLGMALLGSLVLGLPQTSSAQALGTMQVTARVVDASVAWAGVAEGREAARAARGQSGRPLVRRNRLLLTRAEIRPSGGRRLLIVTIHHPHN